MLCLIQFNFQGEHVLDRRTLGFLSHLPSASQIKRRRKDHVHNAVIDKPYCAESHTKGRAGLEIPASRSDRPLLAMRIDAIFEFLNKLQAYIIPENQ